MNKEKRIAWNMIAQILAFLVNVGINLWLTPFVTIQVGKEVYGFVNLAFQFTSYISIITVAMNAMLGRFITMKLAEKNYKSASTYFSTVTIANAIMSLLLLIPTVFVLIHLEKIIRIPDVFVADVKVLWLFIFLSFLFGLIFEAYGVAMFATNRLDLSAKRNIENYLIKALILMGMYYFLEPKVWFIGFATFLSGIYLIGKNYAFKKKYLPQLVVSKNQFDLNAAKEMIRLGVWNSINLLSQNLISGLDMMITNLFIGAAEMTLMGFAKSIPVYINSMITMIASSFSPTMMKEYTQLSPIEFVKKVNTYMRICGFLCVVPVIGFIFFGFDFFCLWLPTLTKDEALTVQLLTIMIMAQTIFTIYVTPLFTINTITCKLSIPVLVNLFVGIGNVIGTMLLLKYTNLGIFSVQLVSSSLMILKVGLFNPIYASHVLKVPKTSFLRTILVGLFASCVMGICFYFIKQWFIIDCWITFIMLVFLSGIIGYGISFMLILKKEDRDRLLKKIVQKNT